MDTDAMAASSPWLTAAVLRFARRLHTAGLPVSTDRSVLALKAVERIGMESREDFRNALRACLVATPEQRSIFDGVFEQFWKRWHPASGHPERTLAGVRARDAASAYPRPNPPARLRAADAATMRSGGESRTLPVAHPHGDMRDSASGAERLRWMDFEHMSAGERAAAAAAIARLDFSLPPLPTRRSLPGWHGDRVDWRATLQRAGRRAGELGRPVRLRRRIRRPVLVGLCDVSGSMSAYSRMMLHFLHAAAYSNSGRLGEVYAFTFATRLTHITACLRQRSVDAALASAGRHVRDWDSGTRIGACLRRVNLDWSRRVLLGGAVVLLITDGLDRESPGELAGQMQRLQLSCRTLIWLNPLLRWSGFEPRAAGMRAMLPHVDRLFACHSLDSLESLVELLSNVPTRDGNGRLPNFADGFRVFP